MLSIPWEQSAILRERYLIGLDQTGETINKNFPLLQAMIHRVRKLSRLAASARQWLYVAWWTFRLRTLKQESLMASQRLLSE